MPIILLTPSGPVFCVLFVVNGNVFRLSKTYIQNTRRSACNRLKYEARLLLLAHFHTDYYNHLVAAFQMAMLQSRHFQLRSV